MHDCSLKVLAVAATLSQVCQAVSSLCTVSWGLQRVASATASNLASSECMHGRQLLPHLLGDLCQKHAPLLQDVVWDSFHDQPNDDGWYPFGEGVSAAEQRGRTFLHWLMQR